MFELLLRGRRISPQPQARSAGIEQQTIRTVRPERQAVAREPELLDDIRAEPRRVGGDAIAAVARVKDFRRRQSTHLGSAFEQRYPAALAGEPQISSNRPRNAAGIVTSATV